MGRAQADFNLDKHGFDFADLADEFFERATIVPTKLKRFLAINVFGDSVVTVVFALLGGEAVAVISMRPASAKERDLCPVS